jgi:hypothetical protein
LRSGKLAWHVDRHGTKNVSVRTPGRVRALASVTSRGQVDSQNPCHRMSSPFAQRSE